MPLVMFNCKRNGKKLQGAGRKGGGRSDGAGQGLCRFRRVCGGENGGNHGNAVGPRGQHLGEILLADAAQREDRQMAGSAGLSQPFNTLGRTPARLGRGVKDRAEGGEIGAADFG